MKLIYQKHFALEGFLSRVRAGQVPVILTSLKVRDEPFPHDDYKIAYLEDKAHAVWNIVFSTFLSNSESQVGVIPRHTVG